MAFSKGWLLTDGFCVCKYMPVGVYVRSEEEKIRLRKMVKATHFKKGNPIGIKNRFNRGNNASGNGKSHYKWLGDKISIRGVHTWIERQKGKPQVCEHCGATRKEKWLHWSNIDHKYRKNLDDYISLCVPCHIKYDVKYNNRKFRRKNKIKK